MQIIIYIGLSTVEAYEIRLISAIQNDILKQFYTKN